jgi:hypothetical protein
VNTLHTIDEAVSVKKKNAKQPHVSEYLHREMSRQWGKKRETDKKREKQPSVEKKKKNR